MKIIRDKKVIQIEMPLFFIDPRRMRASEKRAIKKLQKKVLVFTPSVITDTLAGR